MKVFVAYDKANEDQHELLDTLKIISDALHAAGVESYSAHLQQDATPSGDTMKAAFGKIDECDSVLAVVQTEARSEAAILEIGYAYGRKPIHVFARAGVHLASFELADSLTEWSDTDQLTQQIKARFTPQTGA